MLSADHVLRDPQPSSVGADLPPDQTPTGAQIVHVGGDFEQQDQLVGMFAETVYRAAGARIAHGNQLYAILRDRGRVEEKGKVALDAKSLATICVTEDEQWMVQYFASLEASEKGAVKQLEIAMAAHWLGPHVQSLKGIGLNWIGRLLYLIGDPYIKPAMFDADDNPIADARPRTVGELFEYCGYGDPTRNKRKKGQRLRFNPEAKTCLWVIADAAYRGGAYRELYVTAKAAKEGAVHTEPCQRCAGKGKPAAPVGSPWRKGHIHAHALRKVKREILRDLWREAKRLHELAADHVSSDAQPRSVGGNTLSPTTTNPATPSLGSSGAKSLKRDAA